MGPRKTLAGLTGIPLLAGLLYFQCACAGGKIDGTVIGVSDGDTITVIDASRHQRKIRLHQIDAPEKGQDYGTTAKRSLAALVFGKPVTVEAVTTDRYGRTVGKVWVDGKDANLEQVKRGMAWVYRKYARERAYFVAENEARRAKAGLWAQPNPVPPWEFRRHRKSGRDFESQLLGWLRRLQQGTFRSHG